MSYPIFIPVTQGETLDREFRFVGEDIRSATVTVKTSIGIPDGLISTSKPDNDTIGVLSNSTENFAEGIHDLQLWFSWPSGPANEIAVAVKVAVDKPL